MKIQPKLDINFWKTPHALNLKERSVLFIVHNQAAELCSMLCEGGGITTSAAAEDLENHFSHYPTKLKTLIWMCLLVN